MHAPGLAALVVAAAAAATAPALRAQVQWTRRPLLPRTTDPVAFDVARGRLVLFSREPVEGTQETWEWDGADWRRAAAGSGPSSFGEHAMAYDAVRQRVVVFGGR